VDGLVDSVLDVDPGCLSHDERLELLERIEHTRIDAQAQSTLAALAGEGDAERRGKEWVREEVACVLSLAPVTAGGRLHDAVRELDEETVAKVEARVLPRAEGQAIGVFRQAV
jgi:hypothetical protein